MSPNRSNIRLNRDDADQVLSGFWVIQWYFYFQVMERVATSCRKKESEPNCTRHLRVNWEGEDSMPPRPCAVRHCSGQEKRTAIVINLKRVK
jgi:hypothetical protein